MIFSESIGDVVSAGPAHAGGGSIAAIPGLCRENTEDQKISRFGVSSLSLSSRTANYRWSAFALTATITVLALIRTAPIAGVRRIP